MVPARQAAKPPPLQSPHDSARGGQGPDSSGGRSPLRAGRAARHGQPAGRCRAGCVHPPDSQLRRQLPLSLRAGGWKERVKAAEQPTANMYVAAEASVPNQIIIKPNQNNANVQHRLVLKKCCLFLLISPAKPVTLGREAQWEGPSQGQLRGKKPQGRQCFCRQQESTTTRVTALSIYPRDIRALYSSTTYTSTSKKLES